MAKPPRTDLPLPEELLDRSIGVLEGPVNRVMERVWRSRLVLLPVGIGQAVLWKSLGLVAEAFGTQQRSTSTKQEKKS